MNKKQIQMELNLCLLEQGPDWYENKFDLAGLLMLGLFELHSTDLIRLLEEELENAE